MCLKDDVTRVKFYLNRMQYDSVRKMCEVFTFEYRDLIRSKLNPVKQARFDEILA